MTTTARTFYPTWLTGADGEWDGTDPSGGDVRRAHHTEAANNVRDTTTRVAFGTAAGTLVVDPFTTNSAALAQDRFGWALNLAGAEGMGATPEAHRRTVPGDWRIRATLRNAAAATTLSNYQVRPHVYRISADGATRTLLFTAPWSTAALVNDLHFHIHEVTQTGVPEHRFAPGETLMVSWQVRKVDSTLVAETLVFGVGNGPINAIGQLQNLASVILPEPGLRTAHLPPAVTITGVGSIPTSPRAIGRTANLTGVGDATATRAITAHRTADITGTGALAATKHITPQPVTVTGVGSVTGRIEIPLGNIPAAARRRRIIVVED